VLEPQIDFELTPAASTEMTGRRGIPTVTSATVLDAAAVPGPIVGSAQLPSISQM
jgi:hypothetical protein